MEHVISVLVENRSGVLARVAGLFSGRGYNIDSLAVAPSNDPNVSCMTIVCHGDDRIIEQIGKQLNKLIDTVTVRDLTADAHIEREMALVKVAATAQNRAEVIQIATIFRARIIDVDLKSLTIEVVGDKEKVDALIELMRGFGIKELVRTGRVAISRG
jgi:acetolactate synthase-1/3 small subunit